MTFSVKEVCLVASLQMLALCSAQAPSSAPTLKPTMFPTYTELTMGSVQQAFYEGVLAACGVAFFGLLLGLANWKHDRERAEKKLNKVKKIKK
jgi:hypothetical protein